MLGSETLESTASSHISFRPAWRYQWASVFLIGLCIVTAIGCYVLGELYGWQKLARFAVIAATALALYLFVLAFYRRYRWLYTIDREHIESRRGLIGRQVRAVRIRDLRNINVRQSLMQRLLNVGEVEFSSAAGEEVEVVFFGVPDPIGLKDHVLALQESGGATHGATD